MYISKVFSARMGRQNAWVVLLFNEKVGDVNIYIYIHSVILVTNSYDGFLSLLAKGR